MIMKGYVPLTTESDSALLRAKLDLIPPNFKMFLIIPLKLDGDEQCSPLFGALKNQAVL